MYLTTLDPKTGLLDITDVNDGIVAIKEFRALIDDKEYGIECLTAVALTADYLSAVKHYDETDRPRKAMEEVTGDRDKWTWNVVPIQEALKKYEALQYDADIEEGRIHRDQKVSKLKEIATYEKWERDPDDPTVRPTMPQLKKQLREINKDIEDYEKRVHGRELFNDSPVKNGYKLTRLEQKLEKRNSFYKELR